MPHSLLTPPLRAAVEQLAARVPARELAGAAEALSEAYRSAPDRPVPGRAMLGDAARLAYLVTRFPGTLAALGSALAAALPHLPAESVEDAMELGSGPGPSLWALPAAFPALAHLRLVDADPRMLAVARDLATVGGAAARVRVETLVADLRSLRPERADLVVLSFALGELPEHDRVTVLQRAWQSARVALVLVEPGTSAGFARVRDARAWLLAEGARVIAPCPHGDACPMQPPDWCHFAARVERTRLHRQLKHGTLGYEDEKFSYAVFHRSRDDDSASATCASRVVARPQVRTGLVQLRVCAAGGLRDVTVSRRRGDTYRAARHLAWGDAWER